MSELINGIRPSDTSVRAELTRMFDFYSAGIFLITKYALHHVFVDRLYISPDYQFQHGKLKKPVLSLQEFFTTELRNRLRKFVFNDIHSPEQARKVAINIASWIPSLCQFEGVCEKNYLYEDFLLLKLRAVEYLSNLEPPVQTGRFYRQSNLSLLQISENLAKVVDIVNKYSDN